jgi:DNA modification methylase
LRVADLIADPANQRLHPTRNVEMMAASLRDVGAARSIVIDEGNLILAGNGVTAAAASAGITKVRVIDAAGDELIAVRRSGLTDAQKRALALYDNRTAELAEWNLEQIHADQTAGLPLEAWWSTVELADLLGVPALQTGRTDPETVPVSRATTIQPGDLFTLGAHRLLCGDATRAADVARVMQQASADLVFTSPPYGQQRDYTQRIPDWDALMQGVFAHLPAHETTQVVVNLGLIHRENEVVAYWDPWIGWMRAQGWRRFGWYVWDQGSGLPGDWNGRLAPSFEFLFHFNRAAVRARKTKAKQPTSINSAQSARSRTMRGRDGTMKKWSSPEAAAQPRKIPDSVIRITRQVGKVAADLDHPAVFPVALAVEILGAFSDPASTVFEPFAGSGSQLIAAEQLARACCAIELEPRYCQVVIDRWEAFTGSKAHQVRS